VFACVPLLPCRRPVDLDTARVHPDAADECVLASKTGYSIDLTGFRKGFNADSKQGGPRMDNSCYASASETMDLRRTTGFLPY